MLMTVDRQAFFFLPALNGANIATQEGRDFLPGVQTFRGIAGGHRPLSYAGGSIRQSKLSSRTERHRRLGSSRDRWRGVEGPRGTCTDQLATGSSSYGLSRSRWPSRYAGAHGG